MGLTLRENRSSLGVFPGPPAVATVVWLEIYESLGPTWPLGACGCRGAWSEMPEQAGVELGGVRRACPRRSLGSSMTVCSLESGLPRATPPDASDHRPSALRHISRMGGSQGALWECQ